MIAQNYYLLTTLPPLGDLGGSPPLRPEQLLELLGDAPSRELAEMIFLGDDLLQRDSLLAGREREVQPAVLSAEQLRDAQPLPDYLAAEAEEQPPRVVTDMTWAAYFRHAANVALRHKSGFLAAWVAFEVALRNALAAERAKALDLEPGDYLVATDLAGPDEDLAGLVSEWSNAPDPLAALQILDRARWLWMQERDRWFSFADDELAAYAAKLMLLNRWDRLSDADGGGPGPVLGAASVDERNTQ